MAIPYWISINGPNKSIWTTITIPANETVELYVKKESGYSPNAEQVFIKSIDGLVGCWHFNEGSGNTAYDSSGNGNNGTINGATWVDGYYGKALEFDGVDDNIRIQDSESLSVSSELTMMARIYTINFHASGGIIVNKDNSYEYAVFSNGRVKWAIENEVFWNWCDSNYNVALNTWTHISIVYESANSIKTYGDGNLKHTGSFGNGDINNTNNELWIGIRPDNQPFNGIIDEVMIFNRALSSEEIELLYNNQGVGGYDGKCYIKQQADQEVQIIEEQLSSTEWKYTITNPNNTDLIDYQIKIDGSNIVTSTTDSLNITTKGDFGYHIDSDLNIWVMPKIDPGQSMTFYMKSDDACFPESWIFDHLKTSIDPNKWDINCQFVPDTDGTIITEGYIQCNQTVDNKIVDLTFKTTSSTSTTPLIKLGDKILVKYNNGNLDFYLDYDTQPNTVAFSTTLPTATLYRLIIDFTNGTDIYLNNANIYSNANKTYTGLNTIILGDENNGNVNVKYCDIKVYPKSKYSVTQLLKNL